MHWDDLKILQAVSQAGSYAGAARETGLNETTVSRRIARIEQDLGAKIFDTIDGERILTETGQQVFGVAVGMQREFERLHSLKTSTRPTVSRRIATFETIVTHFLAPTLPSLIEVHPHLRIDIILSTDVANFSRWETDIALRMVRPEKGNVIMRKITNISWFAIRPMHKTPVCECSPPDRMATNDEREQLQSALGVSLPLVTVNSLTALKRLILNGNVVGFLPDYMCHDLWENPDYHLEDTGVVKPIWLLIQEHLRNDPETRIITDWIVDAFA